jgi:hypothetical protein
MDATSHRTDRDIERLLTGRIPAGEEDPELARFLLDFEAAYPEPSVDHCEAAHLSAIFAAAQQAVVADHPAPIGRETKEDKVTRRRVGLLAWVGIAALVVIALGTTVAFAGPGVFTGGSDTTVTPTTPMTVETVAAPTADTTASTTDTTASTTDTNAPGTDTTAPTTDTTVDQGTTETTQPGDTATSQVTGKVKTSTTHPDNFGGTISSLRHSGDHTPAAVMKGKKVPGYNKKVTTTTTEPTTPPT